MNHFSVGTKNIASVLMKMIQKAFDILNIFSSLAILNLRSKRAFFLLLSALRIIIALLTVIRISFIFDFFTLYTFVFLLTTTYFLFSIFTFIYFTRKNNGGSEANNVLAILIDTILITVTITIPDIANSDFFLVYFLPLLTAAHYLQSPKAVLATIGITICFIAGELYAHRENSQPIDVYIYSLTRAGFLCVVMIIYRIQRRLPQPHEDSPKSPVALREALEKRLIELSERIHCKTISLQLLYRERFIIVATYGYPKSTDIRKIEFPENDPRYPNHLVASTKKTVIVNTNNYPHFSDPIYHATHIRTWMGVPLISPTTSEFLGLVNIDSAESNAYDANHEKIASRIAKIIAAEITDAQLGPASLTMTTKRELMSNKISLIDAAFSKFLIVEQLDELKFSDFVVQLGKDLFDVEDCSLYFTRKNTVSNAPEQVLHLVASSTIPKHTFSNHESPVDIKPRIGLTGYALASNQLLNLGHRDIFDSQFHNGTYNQHLSYLHSKRSRQIMIIPLTGTGENQIGVLKLENKLGWISDNPFPYMDERLFGIFSVVVSLYLEQIRLRNSTSRWRKQIHDTRGDLRVGVIQQLTNVDKTNYETRNILSATNHIASMLEGILMDTEYSHALESYGILYALKEFIAKYTQDVPNLAKLSERFFIYKPDVRDELPFHIREIFYNIGCESIRNIIHHVMLIDSNSRALIKLKYYRSQFILLVGNTGHGFELNFGERIRDPHHFGLRYIDEEAKRGNATLKIRSSAKYGTLVRLAWKIEEKE